MIVKGQFASRGNRDIVLDLQFLKVASPRGWTRQIRCRQMQFAFPSGPSDRILRDPPSKPTSSTHKRLTLHGALRPVRIEVGISGHFIRFRGLWVMIRCIYSLSMKNPIGRATSRSKR